MGFADDILIDLGKAGLFPGSMLPISETVQVIERNLEGCTYHSLVKNLISLQNAINSARQEVGRESPFMKDPGEVLNILLSLDATVAEEVDIKLRANCECR